MSVCNVPGTCTEIISFNLNRHSKSNVTGANAEPTVSTQQNWDLKLGLTDARPRSLLFLKKKKGEEKKKQRQEKVVRMFTLSQRLKSK